MVQGCWASVHVSAVRCGAVAVLLAAYVVMQRVGTVAGAQGGINDTMRDERGHGETLFSS